MFENDMDDFINNNHEPYPYIKEISYSNDVRKIKISANKGIIIAVIILLCAQVIMIIMGLTLFKDMPPLKIFFCVIELPFVLIMLLYPASAICQYDYKSRTFISYVIPFIPIPYMCFSTKEINFNDIEGFFLKKKKNMNKKYYKIGVKLKDESQRIIIVGQDTGCKSEYDEKLNYIPFILRRLLKAGEQNIV